MSTHYCEFCGTEFSTKSNLNRHLQGSKSCKSGDTEKYSFPCKKCKKQFTSKQGLVYHLGICKVKGPNRLQLIKEIHVEKREKDQEDFRDNLTQSGLHLHSQSLIINDYQLIYRETDGYINVTNLCKAGGKEFKAWNRTEKTQDFLRVLSTEVNISTSRLIEVVSGGNSNLQGTWAHPQVAINIAQWVSPIFDVKVSRWIYELMVAGRVELGKEKTNEELESLYKEQITNLTSELETTKEKVETLTSDYKTLLVKHISSSKNHRYTKFKDTDPCFYIIESGVSCNDCGNTNLQYKFGIAGTEQRTIDDRLQSHRTLWPLLKVRYVVFLKNIVMIENSFKMMFEDEINPNGHEIIEGVSLAEILDRLKKLFDLLCIKNYHTLPEEKMKEYNDYVETTVKPL